MSGNGHKVLIQISILENGKVGFSSTSKNPATNVWLCELGKDFFKGNLVTEKPEEQRIVTPRFEI